MAVPQLLQLGGLARVTGVREPTLLRWLDRGSIESSHFDTTTSGSGEYRKFSRNTVNKIALAKKLIGLGIPVGPANNSAAQYTDFGDDKRAANKPYEFGRTILIRTEAGTTIKNLDPDASLSDVLGRPMTRPSFSTLGRF